MGRISELSVSQGGTAAWRRAGTRRLRPPVSGSPAALDAWRTAASERLIDLLALPTDRADGELIIDPPPAEATEPQLIALATADGDIPCWLLRPPADRRLGAAVVAIAGHGPGIDALVAPSSDANDFPAADDFHGGLARKLARAGFTVLCPEMISFGRRRTPMPDTAAPTKSTCQVDAMRGLLTGRPVLGRRVADALAAVRAARRMAGVDPARIAVVGGSGGGAIALLAAAIDDRLPAAVVAAFFSTFADSLGSVPHCICNAVPDLLSWFEMADIAALIAPRRLIIETGRRDPIFPIGAAEIAYAELVDAWRTLGSHHPPDLVITDAEHQFLADESIALLRGHLFPDP